MSALATVAFGRFDLRFSLCMCRLGLWDPTASLEPTSFEKMWMNTQGVLRAVFRATATSGEVCLEITGKGAEEVLAAWLRELPPRDGHDTFAPAHPLLRRLHRARGGLRLLRVPWLFDAACSAILQQRVTFSEARRGWARIARAHGERGDGGVAFPGAERLAEVPGWELERLGIDPKRGRALLALAREQTRRPFLSLETERGSLRERLIALPGIGPWTVEMVLGFGTGDPDAVLIGDLHAPRAIALALAGEGWADDSRMLSLLEPYRGQRFRVTRLILGQGSSAPVPGHF